jgi:copper resistance protein D
MTVLFAAVRAVHFISLMVVFGAAALSALLRAHKIAGPPDRMTRIVFPAAAALGFVTAIAWFFVVAGRMLGDWRGMLDPANLRLVATATAFGRVAVWRMAGLALMLCLSPARTRTGMTAALAALLLGSLGLTSHAAAAAGDLPLLRAGNDAAHLLAAGFWIGGLVVLASFVRQHLRQPQKLVAPFRLFSRWGSVAVVVLIFSGIVNAASILPAHSLSTANSYVDILAVKIVLALGMVVLAVVNRLELVPALDAGHANTARQLSLSVFAEIILGIVVIAIVGYLGQMAPQ